MGRVKRESANFDNFSRDQVIIVPKAAIGPSRRFAALRNLVAIGA
jgi:hypothetical protein